MTPGVTDEDLSQPSVVDREPVAVYSAVAIVVAAAAAAFGVVVDPSTIVAALTAVVALVTAVTAAVKARQKVTPTEFPKFN